MLGNVKVSGAHHVLDGKKCALLIPTCMVDLAMYINYRASFRYI